MIEKILKKLDDGNLLTREDAIVLLNINNKSTDFYRLISKANELSRKTYNNRGYIFAQIGLNSSPCSGNCKFCSLAKDNFSLDILGEKSADAVVSEARTLIEQNISDLFLMTTADYDFDKFIEISKKIKAILPENIRFVANIGDFSIDKAMKLKDTGFTGAYHIVRLREGIDTDIRPETRIATLDAIKSAGLELYYCVEPIGREHSYEEIADEMLRARDYNVNVMAVMRRVGVEGTIFADKGQISEIEFTKIAAVTRLVTNPQRSMNVHEPVKMALLAGVNQLYAEIGVNPRDNKVNTEQHRGLSVADIRKMLNEAEYTV